MRRLRCTRLPHYASCPLVRMHLRRSGCWGAGSCFALQLTNVSAHIPPQLAHVIPHSTF